MKVIWGGARGSSPVSGENFLRYGGDTFALLIEGRDGAQVLVDAGSGVRKLKKQIRPGATILLTHLHLDHLIGLPALESLWPQQWIFPGGDFRPALERVFSPPIWPVALPPINLGAAIAPVEVGGLKVSWHEVAHPDRCWAYRVDEPATGACAVIATDVEWPAMPPSAQESFIAFAHGADLLAFDAHFAPKDMDTHRGWGHSSWADAVDVAQRCGAKKCELIHHAPSRTDSEISALVASARTLFATATSPTTEQTQKIT